ncbi:MAG: hypothetical protein LBT38_02515 [Deltaproteobacteria bacterium]|nr:hypothetical protein [Deltaproteobacteria bacterium]
MIYHTYLLQPGLWIVEGFYYDRDDSRHNAKGQLLITHGRDEWILENEIRVSGEDRRLFVSRYTIQPMSKLDTFTNWKSEVGGPEPLYGLFVLVEDMVMMPWQSGTGYYWGQEIMAYKSPDEYVSRGYAFINSQKVSSWAFMLTRQSG